MGKNYANTKIIESNGSKKLEVVLDGETFFLPFKVIGGRAVGFLDISGQVSLIEHSAEELVKLMEKAKVEFDTILNPVSKSNALAHAVAVRWSSSHTSLIRTVVARKSTDPNNKVQAVYHSVTTPKDQILSLTPDDATYLKGKNILIIDDVYGGGGTTKALYQLANEAGAQIVAHSVIAVEQGVALPKDLFYLFTLPVLDS